jgi:iron complex outermembrane receptor protein
MTCAAIAALTALSVMGRAYAQDASGAGSSPGARGDQVADVVVTAQRRSQNLEKVPIAVSAFSATAIDQTVVQNSTELLEFVPNVLAFNNGGQQGQANYFFRGVGTPDGLQTFDSPVVTYLDEVPLGRIVGANINFLDIDQVEVLRGPQGTLFGRNVTGGAVLYTSHKPTADFGMSAQAEYGSRDHFDVRGSVNAPVNDQLFTSVAGYYLREDGYEHDVYNGQTYGGQNSYGFRGALRYVPSTKVEWNLSLDYSRQDGENLAIPGAKPSGTFAPDNSGQAGTGYNSFTTIASVLSTCETGAGDSGLVWAQNGCQEAAAINYGVTSNLRYTINDHLAVNFITGARETGENYSLDFSGRGPTTAPTGLQIYDLANDSTFKQISQEIKLTGDFLDGRIKYVGGAFFFHEDDSTQINTFFNWPGLGFTKTSLADNAYLRNSTTSYAGYIQADTAITDKLTLTTGFRYTHDDKKVGIDFTSYTFLYTNYNTSQIAGVPSFSADKGTPKVSLQYQFTPEIMTYASYTSGFKSGGWSGRASSAAAFEDFRDEVVDSYELGARTELFDKRLRLNATLFRANYTGLQINTAYNLPNGTVVYVTGNAGNAYDQGLELESQYVITHGLIASLNLGLQDSKYTKLTAGAVLSSGFTLNSHLTETPPATLSGGISWDHDWTAIRGSTQFSTNFQYMPPYNPTVTGSSVTTAPITVLNGQITYRPANSHFEFAVECRNCTQSYYFASTNISGGGTLGVIPFEGIRIKYKM